MEWPESGLVQGYHLLSRLGRGSHGEVYRAIQSSTGQLVAVKILQIRTSPQAPPRSTQVERFRREMMACAALQHPNIVRAIDAGTAEDGRLYSVFEYVPGPTLRVALREHRALPMPRLREFLLQTLDALMCAHAKGIIHRDFKPENIVVSSTGVRPHFKVLDFGISAFREGFGLLETVHLTSTGETLGTPAYAAPEQLRGEAPTPRTDLYAWGLVALECLTGSGPMHGLSLAEVHYQQLLPDPIRLPPELEQHPFGQLLRWVLCKQPERRASEASAVYARLEGMVLEDLVNAGGYLVSEPCPPSLPMPTPTLDADLQPRGERRLLTVLCLRFTLAATDSAPMQASLLGSSLDSLLQEQRRRSERALTNAGGQLVSFVGSRALGIFGFPTSSEQDSRHAIQCAIDLHQSVALHNHARSARLNVKLQLSGGLHTGLVTLQGDEGTADQVAGWVLAEASDLADRALPGEILVSAASELPSRHDVELEAAGEVVLATSGKTWPVYRLLGARDPFPLTSSQAPLFGRRSDLTRLERELHEAAEGKLRSVWVEGEAGVGKSALLRHLRGASPASGEHWLIARCLPDATRVALHPILELLRRQLGLSALTPDAGTAHLKECLTRHGFDADTALGLLCPWLQLPLHDARPPLFAPQRLREMSIDILARFVASLLATGARDGEGPRPTRRAAHSSGVPPTAPGPAVLVLEDAHWCDATTREWLEAFRGATRGRPILLLVTTRPGFDPRIRAACAPHTEIVLGGLPEEDATALVNELAGEQPLEPNLVREMLQRADGVPLFLQELTRYVQSHRFASDRALEIPHSLRELLGARLDQLGPAKASAQVAAVIGREFDLALLQRISLRDSVTLLGDIEQLLSAGLIEMQRRIGEPRYRFRHVLLQATAYETLTPSARENTHRRVAQTLEAEFPEITRTQPQFLARHWALASAEQKALPYAKRASMDLLLRSSHLELVEHSQTALSWVKAIPDAKEQSLHELDLMLPYVLASMSVRGYAEASVGEVVARAEALLEEVPEYAGAFGLLFAVSLFYHVQGRDRRRAQRAAQRVVAFTEGRPEHHALRVFAWSCPANCHYAEGQFDLAQSFVEKVSSEYALELHGPMAWQFGFDAWVAAATVGILIDWSSGRLDRSHARLRALEEHAEALGHPESLAQVLFTECVLAHSSGDWEQLARSARKLAEVAREHRLDVYSTYSRLFAALGLGDIGAAVAAFEQLQSSGHVGSTSYQCSILTQIELASGATGDASNHVQRGIAHAESSGERFWLPRLLYQRAMVSHRLGHARSTSEADLDAAIAEASHRGMLMFELEANIVRSTLSSNQPTSAWDGTHPALGQDAVRDAIETLRKHNAAQQRRRQSDTAS